MADPVTNIIACQFKIPLDKFEYGEGNLDTPDKPGYSSLINGLVVGTVEGAFAAITVPLNALLEGPIKLLEWITEITANFIETMIDILKTFVIDPFLDKLKVWLPPIPLNIPGLGTIELPELNPDSPLKEDESWLPQVEGYINMLINLIIFPINIVMEVFAYIIDNFSFPAINLDFLNKIWEKIVPAFGYVPNNSDYDSITQLGACAMEELAGLIPPIFPSNAPLTPPSAGQFPANVGFNGRLLTQDEKISFSENQLQIDVGYRMVDTKIEYQKTGDAPVIVLPDGSFDLKKGPPSANENKNFILTRTADPEIMQEATIILKSTPVSNPQDITTFKFKVRSKAGDLLSDLQAAYAANGGVWHNRINIFGIRDTNVQYESSVNANWNKWKDIFGMALFHNNQWVIIANQATTSASWHRIEWNASHHSPPLTQPAMHWPDNTFMADLWYVDSHGRGGFAHSPAFIQHWEALYDVIMDPSKIGRMGPGNVIRRQQATAADLGMNGHTTGPRASNNDPATVDTMSWGCQVTKSVSKYFAMMDTFTAVGNANGYRTGPSGQRYGYMLFSRPRVEGIWNQLKSRFNISHPQD